MSFVFPPSLFACILASHIKSLKEGRKCLPWELCFWVPILHNFLPVCQLHILGYEIFNKHNVDGFPPRDLYFTKWNFYNCTLPPPPRFCLMGTLGGCCWFWDSTAYFQQITVLKPMKSDSSKHDSVISEYKWFIFLFPLGHKGKGHTGMCEVQPPISKWFQKEVERFMFFGVRWES